VAKNWIGWPLALIAGITMADSVIGSPARTESLPGNPATSERTAQTSSPSAGFRPPESQVTSPEHDVMASADPAMGTPPTPMPEEAPPRKEGCYTNTGGKWREIPCASPAYIKKHYPPPAPPPAGLYSVKSNARLISAPNQKNPNPNAPPVFSALPLDWGAVTITFMSGPASVTDTKFGSNAFSIQVNTNYYVNNVQKGWVQFTAQSKPGQPDGICIWNWNFSHIADPVPKCASGVPITTRGIPAGLARVVGYIAQPASGSGPAMLTVMAFLPWEKTWYSAVLPDIYGLSGVWTEVSGSILGFGSGSEVNFTKAHIHTHLDAFTCLQPYTAVSCVTPAPASGQNYADLAYYATVSFTNVTAETNNLTPDIGYPPQPPPPLTCVQGQCEFWYNSTAP
jgi:hypothetical protein